MWNNIVESDRPRVTVWRMRTACWMPKATNAHTEYVILVPFRQQQWLHERSSILRYTHIACIQFIYDIAERGFTQIKFNYKSDNREYLNISQWHSIAVGSTGPHNAGTMWHFSDAGVTCSGKLLVTVTGLKNDSRRKRK